MSKGERSPCFRPEKDTYLHLTLSVIDGPCLCQAWRDHYVKGKEHWTWVSTELNSVHFTASIAIIIWHHLQRHALFSSRRTYHNSVENILICALTPPNPLAIHTLISHTRNT
jgi:hypothetical protein